ncbi:hypothetical protein [Gordonia sp. NPDC003422]
MKAADGLLNYWLGPAAWDWQTDSSATIASSSELIQRLHALGDDQRDLLLPDVTGPSDPRPHEPTPTLRARPL